MKNSPVAALSKTHYRSTQSANNNRRRKGVTVVETALIMVVIVGCLILVLDGMSGKLSKTFSHAGHALAKTSDPASGTENSADSPSQTSNANGSSLSYSDMLLRMGFFAAAMLIFMFYAIFFMSTAETNKNKKQPLDKKPEPLSLANLLFNKRSRINRVFGQEMDDFDSSHLNVAKFMTANPLIVRIHDDIRDIMNLMLKKGFRHLMIVDEQNKLCGIISDRDLFDVEGKSLAEIMTPGPFHVSSTTPVSIAITMLVKNRISALPVVDDERVVGILTRSDLLVTLQSLLMSLDDRTSASAAASDQAIHQPV